MKTKLQILSVALLGVIFTSCSSSMNMSKSSINSNDDIYYTPNKTQTEKVSENTQDIKKEDNTIQKQYNFEQLEDKYKKFLASDDTTRNDTIIYKTENTNPYSRLLSDSYQESYERRLRGMQDPYYRMEGLSTYYSTDYFNAMTYDPALYNVIVMGNQVWVEPWYISSMFTGPHYHVNFNLGFEYGYWNWNPWYSNYYPYFSYNSWYGWNPYNLWGYYKNSDLNYNYENYYYGPRSGNTSSTISNRLRGDNSFENQIASSRRRDALNTSTGGSNLNTRTRNVNQTDITRSGNREQELTRRSNRSGDYSTTRLREGNGNTRNTNMTEPTRRNSNNYQRTRTTSNDGYIRTGTRNQNTDATNRNGNTNRDNSNVREGRNTTPTYNRPNRVDSSTERTRNSNSGNSNRETNYRNSGGNNSSGNASTRTNTGSSSSSNSNQNNSSGGNNSRRR